MNADELAGYRYDRPQCELWSYFRGGEYPRSFGGKMVSSYRRCPPACDIHHIAIGRRVDDMTNVIHVSREVHDWLHMESRAGTVLCIWHKLQKKELDTRILGQIKGVHILGWLQNDDQVRACSISPGLQRMRERTVEELLKLPT